LDPYPLGFALLAAIFVTHGDEADPGRPQDGVGAWSENELLVGVVCFRLEPAFIHGIRNKPTDIGMHAPRHREEDAAIRRNCRHLAQDIFKRG
jgi:hypothetical protein